LAASLTIPDAISSTSSNHWFAIASTKAVGGAVKMVTFTKQQ